MLRTRSFTVTALFVLAITDGAMADRLFVRRGAAPGRVGAVPRVADLELDQAALQRLRDADRATLTEFPLGADDAVTLEVRSLQPFTTDAAATVVEAQGPRALAMPDRRYFTGGVAGVAGSRAFLATSADGIRGFVAAGGRVYRFGADRLGTYRSYAIDDADPAVLSRPEKLCANAEHEDQVRVHPRRVTGGSGSGAPPTAAFSPTLMVEVAIETDEELRDMFASDNDALVYLADLAAAVSAIYDADIDVRVRWRSIRLWNTTDPWSASSTGSMLSELRTYWNANEGATPRDLVHLVSGKNAGGGVAYLDVLCHGSYGYGVSAVDGSFDVMDPSETWDVVVVSHELGHNFGSEHTHCYDPPLDFCYASEAGCYAGPVVVSTGTIMSYCHTHSPGMPNISLEFGATVSAVLRTGAEAGMCVGPPCPDGILDAGEDCDDGNYDDGDCCSNSCVAVSEGGACDDQEDCTGTDVCTAGTCAGTPVVDGTPCDDESLCTSESCQSGTCAVVALPAVGCLLPVVPGKASLQLKDNASDASDSFGWKWIAGDATTVGDFGSPTTTDDYELCVYDADPDLLMSVRAPAGGTCAGVPCWREILGKGFDYKDKDVTPDGLSKLGMRAGLAGKAKITAKGKGVAVPMPPLGPGNHTLPLKVQLHTAGQCWEANFSTATIDTTGLFKAKAD